MPEECPVISECTLRHPGQGAVASRNPTTVLASKHAVHLTLGLSLWETSSTYLNKGRADMSLAQEMAAQVGCLQVSKQLTV